MATTVLLVRHGETDWNRRKIFRGVYDIPLNANGRAQARMAAGALTGRTIDAAYTSPLSRAAETAQIVLASHGVEAAVEQTLKDFDYGQWTGKEDAEVAKTWPAEHAQWLAAPHAAHPPDGDTLAAVSDRAFAAVERIAQQHDGQTVALFAHRVVNKLLVLRMLSLDLPRFPFIRQDNCCITEFQRTAAGYVAIVINDTTHIRQAGGDLLEADF